MTVEGRERYPISVRYARDFRSDIDSLKRVLVSTPTGAQVPISLLADVKYRTGPPSIREENAQLVGYVFVDITSSDIDGYVKAASNEIGQKVHFRRATIFSGRASLNISKQPKRVWRFSCPLLC